MHGKGKAMTGRASNSNGIVQISTATVKLGKASRRNCNANRGAETNRYGMAKTSGETQSKGIDQNSTASQRQGVVWIRVAWAMIGIAFRREGIALI